MIGFTHPRVDNRAASCDTYHTGSTFYTRKVWLYERSMEGWSSIVVGEPSPSCDPYRCGANLRGTCDLGIAWLRSYRPTHRGDIGRWCREHRIVSTITVSITDYSIITTCTEQSALFMYDSSEPYPSWIQYSWIKGWAIAIGVTGIPTKFWKLVRSVRFKASLIVSYTALLTRDDPYGEDTL